MLQRPGLHHGRQSDREEPGFAGGEDPAEAGGVGEEGGRASQAAEERDGGAAEEAQQTAIPGQHRGPRSHPAGGSGEISRHI